MAKRLANIIVHCSDSTWGSAAEIRRWHLQNGWKDIGYHYVISNGLLMLDHRLETMDGSIEAGRPLDGDPFIEDFEIGAHALGYNDSSIGVCLIGKTSFTARQIGSLLRLLDNLRTTFSVENGAVLGHYETPLSKGKTCPNIDMAHVRYFLNLMQGVTS